MNPKDIYCEHCPVGQPGCIVCRPNIAIDPGGFYGFAGYAQPGAGGPKPRDRIQEQATKLALQQHVKRCGHVNETRTESESSNSESTHEHRDD